MIPTLPVFFGFDSRETDAMAVARRSAQATASLPLSIRGIALADLRSRGLYWREHRLDTGRSGHAVPVLWDVISEAPMATEFAISRFLTPHLAKLAFPEAEWALFADSDVLVRRDLAELFELADPSKAVMCVQHKHEPPDGMKMEGQIQTRYRRKNWSSVMLFNLRHPALEILTVQLVNAVPGRDLHGFQWLADDLIGALPHEWNWLAGHSDPGLDPAIVHFTEGVPRMAGYERQPYAHEWWDTLFRWAEGSRS